MDDFSREKEDAIQFIQVLYKKRLFITISLFVALALAITVTFLTPKSYHAFGVVMPPASHASVDLIRNPEFGYEIDANKLIQVLGAQQIRDSIAKIYNLAEYYELDQSKPEWHDQLNLKYVSDIDFERTRYSSVVVSATMKDPELAANVVNSIIDIVDGARNSIMKENTFNMMNALEKDYLDKQKEVDLLIDRIQAKRFANRDASLKLLHAQLKQQRSSINNLRSKLNRYRKKFGFQDLEEQVNILNEQMSDAQIKGEEATAKKLKTKLEELGTIEQEYNSISDELTSELSIQENTRMEYEKAISSFQPHIGSIELDKLIDDFEHESNLLNSLKQRYEEAVFYYTQPIPKVYVVSRAIPSYRSVSPSYIKNIFLALTATFLFCLSILFLQHKISNLPKA